MLLHLFCVWVAIERQLRAFHVNAGRHRTALNSPPSPSRCLITDPVHISHFVPSHRWRRDEQLQEAELIVMLPGSLYRALHWWKTPSLDGCVPARDLCSPCCGLNWTPFRTSRLLAGHSSYTRLEDVGMAMIQCRWNLANHAVHHTSQFF